MRTIKLFPLPSKRWVFLLLILVSAMFLHAQDADDEDEYEGGLEIDSDWSRASNLYTSGDQVFCINLGFPISLFFVDQQEGYFKTKMKLGGFGALAYNYFLTPHWFVGGEVSGMFAATVGGNMFYMIPIGIRGGYQFIANRFEFPAYLLLGVAPQSHNQRTYFGFFAKAAAGAFFRLNSEWSFGLNTSFWWAPEWTKKTRDPGSTKINIHGFFLEASLGARYHF